MIHQLNPPLPVITPKGKALAHVVIDVGIEHDLQWICFQDATGECWTWSNPQIRAQINITLGRDYISPFYHPSEVAFKKEADEDEEDEDEDEDEEIDWKAAYDEKDEEHRESRRVIVELRQEHNGLKESIKQLTDLLGKLYNDDQVHPNQREEVRVALLKTDEYMDGHYGRVMRKSQMN